MLKTAVIYDKWLDSLGGGEVVACSMVRILLDNGYEVTLACRKIVPINIIKQKLNIDITGVKFFEVWNDEDEIQKLTTGKDMFINISFMDYSVGKAKRNIYYAHFPTPISIGPLSFFKNEIILPKLAKYLNPVEFIDPPISQSIHDNHLAYLLGSETSLSFSYLKPNSQYTLRFFVFHEPISKSSMEKVTFNLFGATIQNQSIILDHRHNVLRYQLTLIPNKSSIKLKLINKNNLNKIFLIEPNLSRLSFKLPFIGTLERLFSSKIRSGAYSNIKARIDTYDTIIVHSEFVKHWVKIYWNKDSVVIYPPVDLISDHHSIDYSKKKNIICSVGRFFTLGHGKRQDIMIETFKKMCDQGLTGWKLVLAGGLGTEPSSLIYFDRLQKMAKGYPIQFLINKPKEDIEKLYLNSKIYWHAAGFGVNQSKYPIKLEHFGITPVEAMSAGCIPIVFKGGGLPEIVSTLNLLPQQHIFTNTTQLAANTLKVINKSNIKIYQLKKLNLKKFFGHKVFLKKFLEQL